MHHFHSQTFTSPNPGPRLIILGAVHGNETAGTQGIRRVLAELQEGRIKLASGHVTLVPITNPLAYEKCERNGDRNLNRALGPQPEPKDFEDHVANWLCPLMASHEVLLDLHSFSAQGQPFVMIGPLDNDGDLEPVRHSVAEQAMALRLGVGRVVHGWLSTYAEGVKRRAANRPDATPEQLARIIGYGVGTTEYMRSQGGYGVTLECGQHKDPNGPDVAYRAIINTLAHLGISTDAAPPAQPPSEALHLYEVIDRNHAEDKFSRAWTSFDPVAKDELIGMRHDGSEVRAGFAGRIIFPNTNAVAGEEWFYLARASERFN